MSVDGTGLDVCLEGEGDEMEGCVTVVLLTEIDRSGDARVGKMTDAVLDGIEPVGTGGQGTAALVFEAFQLEDLEGGGEGVACERTRPYRGLFRWRFVSSAWLGVGMIVAKCSECHRVSKRP